jgi:hypothetical protein
LNSSSTLVTPRKNYCTTRGNEDIADLTLHDCHPKEREREKESPLSHLESSGGHNWRNWNWDITWQWVESQTGNKNKEWQNDHRRRARLIEVHHLQVKRLKNIWKVVITRVILLWFSTISIFNVTKVPSSKEQPYSCQRTIDENRHEDSCHEMKRKWQTPQDAMSRDLFTSLGRVYIRVSCNTLSLSYSFISSCNVEEDLHVYYIYFSLQNTLQNIVRRGYFVWDKKPLTFIRKARDTVRGKHTIPFFAGTPLRPYLKKKETLCRMTREAPEIFMQDIFSGLNVSLTSFSVSRLHSFLLFSQGLFSFHFHSFALQTKGN